MGIQEAGEPTDEPDKSLLSRRLTGAFGAPARSVQGRCMRIATAPAAGAPAARLRRSPGFAAEPSAVRPSQDPWAPRRLAAVARSGYSISLTRPIERPKLRLLMPTDTQPAPMAVAVSVMVSPRAPHAGAPCIICLPTTIPPRYSLDALFWRCSMAASAPVVSAPAASRIRVFVDYWNLQLTINESEARSRGVADFRFKIDWQRLPRWIAAKAAAVAAGAVAIRIQRSCTDRAGGR